MNKIIWLAQGSITHYAGEHHYREGTGHLSQGNCMIFLEMIFGSSRASVIGEGDGKGDP